MSKVELNVNAIGMGMVTVDGRDVSNIIRATNIVTRVGTPTVIELELAAADIQAFANGRPNFRVLIGTHVGEGATPRAAVENWLERLDDERLEIEFGLREPPAK